MKQLTVTKVDTGDFSGIKGDEQHYDQLFDEDVEVRKSDGELLCVLLKKKMNIEATAQAWGVLNDYNPSSTNRGIASGEERRFRVKSDGTLSRTHITDPVGSGIVGYFERTPRQPYCRACAWNMHNPEKFAQLYPMIKDADRLFHQHAKKRYDRQFEIAKCAHSDFLIAGTTFSTLTVNKNFRTAYHKDAGNLPDGISCMSVIKKGKWTGANLIFPAYRIAVKLDSFDLIIFDPHEFHGNTPLVKLSPDAQRCSIVYYFREKVQDCQSNTEELERVKNRKQGEQLHRTILRKQSDLPDYGEEE